MRRPLQRQLLIPWLAVVLFGVALASGIAAWWNARLARAEESERIQQLATSLAEGGFPLTNFVLHRMSGLSGAEFMVCDRRGEVVFRSLITGVPHPPKVIPESYLTGKSEETLVMGLVKFRVVAMPVRSEPSQILLVLYPQDQWDQVARQAAVPALIAGLIAACLAVVLTGWLAQQMVRPILELSRQTTRIAAGDFTPLTLPAHDDEIRDLTLAVNRMAEQLQQYEEQVRRGERLRTLGQLGAAVAHQLRNTVTGARMALQFHQRDFPETANGESLVVALRQLESIDAYLQRFLRMGRGESPPLAPMDLNRIVAETIPLVQPLAQHVGVQLHADLTPAGGEARLLGDAEALRQVVLNLVVNGIEAATRPRGEPGEVRVSIELTNDAVRLIVADDGPGLSSKVANRLGDPFVTDKPDGTGLGLWVVKEIATAHRTTLQWSRVANQTRFTLEFERLG